MQCSQGSHCDWLKVQTAGAPESWNNLNGVSFNVIHMLFHETYQQFESHFVYIYDNVTSEIILTHCGSKNNGNKSVNYCGAFHIDRFCSNLVRIRKIW